VVSFSLAFPPITYTRSSSPPFALPVSPIRVTCLTHSRYLSHPFALPVSPIRVTCLTHLILLDLLVLITLGEEYKSCSSSLCSFLHPPVTSSLFGPNIFLSTLFSNTLSLFSSLNVRDQVSHPYRTTGKIIPYSLILTFYDRKKEDRSFRM
jgi:hypothetical protein